MDLSNIKIGNTYKNYKELCKELEEPIKTSNSKIAQLKRWEQHFCWEKSGNQYIITNLATPCNETLTEQEFVLKFATQHQKSLYESAGKLSATIRKTMLSEANRYCNIKYNKDTKTYHISCNYHTPFPRNKNDQLASQFMQMTEQERKLHGVYCIKNENTIYIGSTMRSFYIRFCGHYIHAQEQMIKTKELFDNGGKMYILYVAKPDDTEEYIRKLEIEYIHEYINSDYTLLNYINASSKRKQHYKSIKIEIDKFEEAVKLLTRNNIKIKGE